MGACYCSVIVGFLKSLKVQHALDFGRGFYLEPWVNIPSKYLMFDSWTARYNPKYNEIMPAEHYMKRAVNAVYRKRWAKEPK